MKIGITPEERQAIKAAESVVSRVYGESLERMGDEESADVFDIHASAACLSIELPEFISLIDGEFPDRSIVVPAARVLLDAAGIAERMKFEGEFQLLAKQVAVMLRRLHASLDKE